MAELQVELCVEILVPLKNGRTGYGSGYTLLPHWVLTAHHVVCGDDVDYDRPLTIIWRDEKGIGIKQSMEVEQDTVVWYEARDHDLAVIECDPPYQDVPRAWEVLGRERPKAGVRWESYGYLSGLKNIQDKQRSKNPNGRFERCASEALSAQLTSSIALDDEDLWKGFSGSPVFAGGKLTAVVRAANTHERGRGLVVSFVSAALLTKGGVKALRLTDLEGFALPPAREQSWEVLGPEVVKQLETSATVFDALKTKYTEIVDSRASFGNESELATAMYGAPVDKLSRCLNMVLRSMIACGEADGIRVIEHLAHVWLVLIAADRGNIEEVESFKSDSKLPPFSVKAVEPVVLEVEAQAARGEGRLPTLELKGQCLRSRFDYTPDVQSTGMDMDGSVATGHTMSVLRRKTQPGMNAFVERVSGHLKSLVVDPETGISTLSALDAKDQERLIAWHLELKGDELGGSIYIRVPPASGTEEQSALRELRGRCPPLLLIEVTEDHDPEHMLWVSTLHRIIYNAQQALNA